MSLQIQTNNYLGNTRVNYIPTGFISHPGDPSVAVNRINSVVDYFPYGKVLRHYNVTDERYLTTQHERDQETGLDYRGARYYDGDIGRFLSLDPLAKEYPSLSDYVYVGDNPIVFIDPDGKAIKLPKSLRAIGNAVIGQMLYDLREQSGAKIDHSSIDYEVNQTSGVVRLKGDKNKILKTIDKLYKAGDQHSKELAILYQTLLSPDIELTVRYSISVADENDVEIDGDVLKVNDDINEELNDPNKTNEEKKPTRTEMYQHLMSYFYFAIEQVPLSSGSGSGSSGKKPPNTKVKQVRETIPGISEEEIYDKQGKK